MISQLLLIAMTFAGLGLTPQTFGSDRGYSGIQQQETKMKTTEEFLIGGSIIAVYGALRRRGFVMCGFDDTWWYRFDGLTVHIYGTGSQLSVLKGFDPITDGPMAESLAYIDALDNETPPKHQRANAG